MAHSYVDVPISKLELDPKNPRVPGTPSDDASELQTLLRVEGRKILVLAEHISKNGLNPAQMFMVLPKQGQPGRYIVLDANRRTAALRLLDDPTLAGGQVSGPALTRLKRWSTEFKAHGAVGNIRCVSFTSREEPRPWMILQHAGEQGGAGTVTWGSIQNARYAGTMTPALHVLDLVSEHGHLDDTAREQLEKFRITNLDRLLKDKAVASRLGVRVEDGELERDFPLEQVIPGLTAVVVKLMDKDVGVDDIYDATKRQAFMDGFPKKVFPKLAGKLKVPQALEHPKAVPAPPPSSKVPAGSGLQSKDRKSLIPKTCRCEISQPRLAKIYDDLCRLPLEQYSNSVAVVMRVFVELSMDDYGVRNRLPIKENGRKHFTDQPLPVKFKSVVEHLESKQALDSQQARAVGQCIKDQSSILHIRTLQEYVHNRHVHPMLHDLVALWDTIQPMMEKVWPRKP
jgi:hypothetical protein